jgi:hypothetical protein
MDRTPREEATRDKTQMARKPWSPPNRLEAPPAPPGFVHRWIRVGLRGEDDKVNFSARLREGWEPVKSSEYPGFPAPTIEDGRYEGCIGTGGLILCRIPAETVAERTAYYGNRTRDQQVAVDEELRRNEQQFGVAIDVSRSSKVSVGRGVDS